MTARVGLGLALIVGLAGLTCLDACKKHAAAERGTEPRPLTAELLVAPVVDDHPWVIALVTEISIGRPAGADARLEGRTEVGGLRHPDPIIEGESREAVERAVAAFEAKHPRMPELEPIWEREPFGPGERVAWRLYFVDRSAGFGLDADARATQRRHDHGPSVHLQLSPAQTEQLHALSSDIVGRRLAVVLDGEALMLPVVMAPIDTGDIQLITSPREDPELSAPALLKRLTE